MQASLSTNAALERELKALNGATNEGRGEGEEEEAAEAVPARVEDGMHIVNKSARTRPFRLRALP